MHYKLLEIKPQNIPVSQGLQAGKLAPTGKVTRQDHTRTLPLLL